MARISGMINTLNEADNIRQALGSLLPWCDEVIVVDQHSEDGTAEIAREMGAIVHAFDRTGFVEPARHFAFQQTTGDWVMILDADEIVPAPLARRLRELADRDEPWDAVTFANVNILLGRWTRYGKWWPGYKPRFFRREALVLTPKIHAGIRPVKGARVLEMEPRKDLAIWHFSYHSVGDMVDKANRYSGFEAGQRADRKVPRPDVKRALKAGGTRFWREYLRGRGYQDGWVGLTVGITRAFYAYMEKVKQWDEPRVADRLRSYDRTKAKLLDGYAGFDRPGGSGGIPAATSAPQPPQEPAQP
jgi:glycosyltransferase involved in cell wall biosynthesis